MSRPTGTFVSALDVGYAAGELLRELHHQYGREEDRSTLSTPVLVGPAALALQAMYYDDKKWDRLELTCLKELRVPPSLMYYNKTSLLKYHYAHEGQVGVGLVQLRLVTKAHRAAQVCLSDGLSDFFINPASLRRSRKMQEEDAKDRVTVLGGPAHAMLLILTWCVRREDANCDRAFLALHTLLCLKTLHSQELGLTKGQGSRFGLSPDHFRQDVRRHMLRLAEHVLPLLQPRWFARVDLVQGTRETIPELETRLRNAQMQQPSPLAEAAAVWEAEKSAQSGSPRTDQWRKDQAAKYQDTFNTFVFLLRYAEEPSPPDITAEQEEERLASWKRWAKADLPGWERIDAPARAGQGRHGHAARSLAKPEYEPQARKGRAEATRGW
ncbi:hypothetical protein JCM5296_002240 [Sporobolomyces johnsonii]